MGIFGTIVWLLIIYATMVIARQNGRQVLLSAILAFFFGPIALLGYYILGKKRTA